MAFIMTNIISEESKGFYRGYQRGFAIGAREVLKDIQRFLDEEYAAFEHEFVEAGLEVEKK